MKLSDWLKSNRIRRGEFADMLGVEASFITQICNGSGRPSMATAERIARLTEWQVLPNDFMELPAELKVKS